MKTGVLFTAALGLLSHAATSSAQSHNAPLRNTFAVAAETVIDTANSLDVKADDAHFDPQMKTLQSEKTNLAGMADGDQEHEVLDATNDLIFAVAACHIQAKNGASTDNCQAQINDASKRAMEAINKHKSGGAWMDGPAA